MNKQIEIIRKTRQKILDFVSDLSTDQLNKIPSGFNNNIIWNLAHLIAAQQGVCYLRAGLPMIVEKEFFQAFKPETKPEGFVEENEIIKVKALLFSTLDQLVLDTEQHIFTNYRNWTTLYGIDINNFEDALNFLPLHEGLHMGYIMALKRVVNE